MALLITPLSDECGVIAQPLGASMPPDVLPTTVRALRLGLAQKLDKA